MSRTSRDDVFIEKVLFYPASVSNAQRVQQALAANGRIVARATTGQAYMTAFKGALSGAVRRVRASEERNEEGSLSSLSTRWYEAYSSVLEEQIVRIMGESFADFDLAVDGALDLKAGICAVLCSTAAFLWLLM